MQLQDLSSIEREALCLSPAASLDLDPFTSEDSTQGIAHRDLMAKIHPTSQASMPVRPSYFVVYCNAGTDSHANSLDALARRVNEIMQSGEASPIGGPFWTHTSRGWAQAMLRDGKPRIHNQD